MDKPENKTITSSGRAIAEEYGVSANALYKRHKEMDAQPRGKGKAK